MEMILGLIDELLDKSLNLLIPCLNNELERKIFDKSLSYILPTIEVNHRKECKYPRDLLNRSDNVKI